MKTKLHNLKNEVVGEVNLPESIFSVPWKPALVKQVLEAYRANQRRPWAHAKDRSEVRGGGKKPWRQKGTGRARHGSIRSPLWSGGGKSHGPNKERDYSQKINKKMNRIALTSILSRKLHDNEIKVFDTLEISAPKTKVLAQNLYVMLDHKKRPKKLDVLLVPAKKDESLARAGANLPKTRVMSPKSLNAYELMSYRHIFIDQKAIAVIENQFKAK